MKAARHFGNAGLLKRKLAHYRNSCRPRSEPAILQSTKGGESICSPYRGISCRGISCRKSFLRAGYGTDEFGLSGVWMPVFLV